MNLSLKDIVSGFVFYVALLSGCYLYGYWSPFGINVLEFVQITDLPKLALFSLPVVFYGAIAGVVYAAIIDMFKQSKYVEGSEQVVGVKTYRDIFFEFIYENRFVAMLVYFSLFSSVVLIVNAPLKWVYVGMLLAPLAIPLSSIGFVKNKIKSGSVRLHLMIFIVTVVPFAIFYGGTKAEAVFRLKSSGIVDASRLNFAFEFDAEKPIVYVGLLGDTYFFYESKTGRLVLFPKRSSEPIFVKVPRHL